MPQKVSSKSISPQKIVHSAKPNDKVVVENVNVPGQTTRLDAGKYNAVKLALLRILPSQAPGLTQKQMMSGILPHLPQDLFPNGAKSGWWMKSVQLDLEAKGTVIRDATKPLTWRKA
ncbi:MAG TPA: hypothetical protein PKA58_05220 [Polyangium sp.]|nr:hypothetical protein [Polyangium sp.]